MNHKQHVRGNKGKRFQKVLSHPSKAKGKIPRD